MKIQLNNKNINIYSCAWFSPNLQKFLKKYPFFNQIHLDTKEYIWYIGYKDSNGIWCGARFLAVLCNGSKTKTFSYPSNVVNRFEDRSNQFWRCSKYFGRRMFKKWY